MTVNYGGIFPESRRCNETRAHYAHEWYSPIRILCPGGPDEASVQPTVTISNGTTHCSICAERIWWEESASRKCWVSRTSGSWCSGETSHVPEAAPDEDERMK